MGRQEHSTNSLGLIRLEYRLSVYAATDAESVD